MRDKQPYSRPQNADKALLKAYLVCLPLSSAMEFSTCCCFHQHQQSGTFMLRLLLGVVIFHIANQVASMTPAISSSVKVFLLCAQCQHDAATFCARLCWL